MGADSYERKLGAGLGFEKIRNERRRVQGQVRKNPIQDRVKESAKPLQVIR